MSRKRLLAGAVCVLALVGVAAYVDDARRAVPARRQSARLVVCPVIPVLVTLPES